MTELWTIEALKNYLSAEVSGPVANAVSGVSIDSRTVAQGDLFIALNGDPGPRFGGGNVEGARDGHEFVQAAVEAGAAAVLVDRDVDVNICTLKVDDTLDGLWQIGAAARARSQARCVAVTGSSGKTTLRQWLQTVFEQFRPTHASTGSLNNHWGVPLSLARMPKGSELAVFEVGTNHPGEIAPLSELVSPHIAVLLNVLPAHIGNFEDMAALTREKLSIASGLRPGGTFVLPFDLRDHASSDHLITFGFDGAADVNGLVKDNELEVIVGDRRYRCQPPYLDTGRSQSILALYAVCEALGLDLERVSDAVRQLELPVGRGNLHVINDVTLIDDSYNANPVSTRMAIEDLKQRGSGRRIALLGEMLELGELGPEAHRSVLEASTGLDRVLTFGEGFSEIADSKNHYAGEDSFDLDQFVSTLRPGDTILVKGSNRVFWMHGFVKRLADSLSSS